jgi:hypothetical protein
MAQQDKTPKFPTWRPKSAGMTGAQKRQAALDAQKPKAKAKAPAKKPVRTVKNTMLENVTVMSPKKEKDTRSQANMTRMAPRPMQKVAADSSRVALPKLKAPAVAPPKTMGRGRTALNDATSFYRGAYNTAFGKNQSQTTGGKILERGARLGATALGLTATGSPNAVSTYANQMQKGTNKVTGYVQKGRKAAARGGLKAGLNMAALGTVVAPALIGQMNFKNRTEESKKRGIFNPGKNNSLGINFDKPFQKKTAAADSSSKSKKK